MNDNPLPWVVRAGRAAALAFVLMAWATVSLELRAATDTGGMRVLKGSGGVEVLFDCAAGAWLWSGYRDTTAHRAWQLAGPRFSVQTPDGTRVNLGTAGFADLKQDGTSVVLQAELPSPKLSVRQRFEFCADGRTVRLRTSLRARDGGVTVQRVGLLELAVPGQTFQRMGPELVSSPIFGDRVFAGVEHPSAWCQVSGASFWLAQHSYTQVGGEWVSLPAAVFGSASQLEVEAQGPEALRRAFLRYLDEVRVKPRDLHVHYNDWWTAPVPSSEEFVLRNLGELRRGLYDSTGFFFDSYALDAGWSKTQSVWEIDRKPFPEGFDRIRAALAAAGGHVGLWVSPSSLYPFALDNHWLESAGYEVITNSAHGKAACLAKGGKYQQAFKDAALKHAREAQLAHMKFDGFVPRCDSAEHGHRPKEESFLPLAEGLMEVFDALRAEHPDMALEPTCFGYSPSPWWLMHTPFIIGPFGDDCPRGRCPCPEWIESLTTARDLENLKGRNAFLLPSSALQCFDIIVQTPGPFQNHAVMAVGRGRWFVSCYINPKHMDAEAWRFFADLMRWARHHREFLQEPWPLGGDPEKREVYGYGFSSAGRQLFCVRNPWMEEADFRLPRHPGDGTPSRAREVRLLYPRREVLGRTEADASPPAIHLGPYETQFIEVVPTLATRSAGVVSHPAPTVTWRTAPEGVRRAEGRVEMEGVLEVNGAVSAELCVLLEGSPKVAESRCALSVDGKRVEPSVSRSDGSFSATGAPPREHWAWFTTRIVPGEHRMSAAVSPVTKPMSVRMFVRGEAAAASSAPFDDGPRFPLYHADRRPWSRKLAVLPAEGSE